jgi:RNA polymerase sigma factor (sigma-70 family)
MAMPEQAKDDIFVTTRWTMVLRAGRSDTTGAAAALTELCQAYWYPLYVFVRKRGHSSHDAEDLIQGFFAKLLRLESLKSVSPEKGKFRAFLLASLKNFLAEAWEKSSAKKRDVRMTLSLDAQAAEARYAQEPINAHSPDRLFERQWAVTLLDAAMRRIADQYERGGRGELFRELRFSIAGEKNALPYRDLADRLALSEEALRVAVYRLRKEFRKTLREEIAHTVSNPAEIEDELQELRRILSES